MIKKKRILITGGGGFIGSHLAYQLANTNQVTIFDNGRRNAVQFLPDDIKKKIKVITGDILDKKQLLKALQKQDIILHLAAIAGASSYEKNPLQTLQVNLEGTINLLSIIKNSHIDQVVLFSSSEVYGAHAKNVNETMVTAIGPAYESRWSYAISKLAADHYALAAHKIENIPITIIRPFNVYGPGQIGEGAVSNMLKNALQKKEVVITGKGSQMRSWCYIDDFIQAVALILEKKITGEIFNIGNPKEYYSVFELAKKIQSITGAKIKYTSAVKSEIFERRPDIKRAKQLLSFKPHVKLDNGLIKTKHWFEKHLQQL